jgi:hypothetical protein
LEQKLARVEQSARDEAKKRGEEVGSQLDDLRTSLQAAEARALSAAGPRAKRTPHPGLRAPHPELISGRLLLIMRTADCTDHDDPAPRV